MKFSDVPTKWLSQALSRLIHTDASVVGGVWRVTRCWMSNLRPCLIEYSCDGDRMQRITPVASETESEVDTVTVPAESGKVPRCRGSRCPARIMLSETSAAMWQVSTRGVPENHQHRLPKPPLHPTILAELMELLLPPSKTCCAGAVMALSRWERDIRILAHRKPEEGREHRGHDSETSEDNSTVTMVENAEPSTLLEDEIHDDYREWVYNLTKERRVSSRNGLTEYGSHMGELSHRNAARPRSLLQLTNCTDEDELSEFEALVNTLAGRVCDRRDTLELIRPLLQYIRVPEVVGRCRFLAEQEDARCFQKVWLRTIKQGRDTDEMFADELQQRVLEQNAMGGFGVVHTAQKGGYGLHACICTAQQLWALQTLHARLGERVEFDQTFKVFARRRHLVLAAFCAVHPDPQRRTVLPLMWVIFDESQRRTKVRRMSCAWSLRQYMGILSERVVPPRAVKLVVTDWEKANMSGVMDVQLEEMHAEATQLVQQATLRVSAITTNSGPVPRADVARARDWAETHERLTPRVVLGRLARDDIRSDGELDDFVVRACVHDPIDVDVGDTVVTDAMMPSLTVAALEDLQRWIGEAEMGGVLGKQHSTSFPAQVKLVEQYKSTLSKYCMVFVEDSSVFSTRGCTFHFLSAALKYLREGMPVDAVSVIMGRLKAVCYARTLPTMAKAVGRLCIAIHQKRAFSFLKHFRKYWLRAMGAHLFDPVRGTETTNAVERVWGLLKSGMKTNNQQLQSTMPHAVLPYLGLRSTRKKISNANVGAFDVVAWTTRERPTKPLLPKDKIKVQRFIATIKTNLSHFVEWRTRGIFWVRTDITAAGIDGCNNTAARQRAPPAAACGRQTPQSDRIGFDAWQQAHTEPDAENGVVRRTPTSPESHVRKQHPASTPPKRFSTGPSSRARRTSAARRTLQTQTRPLRSIRSGRFQKCPMGQRRATRIPTIRGEDTRQEMRSRCSCVITSINSATGYCILRRVTKPFSISSPPGSESPRLFPGMQVPLSNGDLTFDDKSGKFVEWEEATIRLVCGALGAQRGEWTTVADMRAFDAPSVEHIPDSRRHLELFPKHPLVLIGGNDAPFGQFMREAHEKYWDIRGLDNPNSFARAETEIWRQVRQEVPAAHLTAAIHHFVLTNWLEDSFGGRTNNLRSEMLQAARADHAGVVGIVVMCAQDNHCYNVSLGGPHWENQGRFWEVLQHRPEDGELTHQEDTIWKLVMTLVRQSPPLATSRRANPVSSMNAVGFVNLPIEFLMEWDESPATSAPAPLEPAPTYTPDEVPTTSDVVSAAAFHSSGGHSPTTGENDDEDAARGGTLVVSSQEPPVECHDHTEGTANGGAEYATASSPVATTPSRVTRSRASGAPLSPFLRGNLHKSSPRMPRPPESARKSHFVVDIDKSTCSCGTFGATNKCEHLLGLSMIQQEVEAYFGMPVHLPQVDNNEPSNDHDDEDPNQLSRGGHGLNCLDSLEVPLSPRMIHFALQSARLEMESGSDRFAIVARVENDENALPLSLQEPDISAWDHAVLLHVTDDGLILACIARTVSMVMYWIFGPDHAEVRDNAQARVMQELTAAAGAHAAQQMSHSFRSTNGEEINRDAGASLIQLSRWIMQVVGRGEHLVAKLLSDGAERWREGAEDHGATVRGWLRDILTADRRNGAHVPEENYRDHHARHHHPGGETMQATTRICRCQPDSETMRNRWG